MAVHSRKWMAFLVLAVGCASRAPEVAAPPAAPPLTKALEQPPTCEDFADGCLGNRDRRARIARTFATFAPMQDWFYAQGEDATVAQSGNGASWFIATGYDHRSAARDTRQEIAIRESELDRLSRDSKVTLSKKKVSWKEPDDTKDVAGLRVGLWEVEGASRNGVEGSLLVFTASLSDDDAVLGLAFVPADDSSGAASLILSAIDTISAGAATERALFKPSP